MINAASILFTSAMLEGVATAQSELIVGSVFRGSMGAARAHGYTMSDERTPETLEARLAAAAFMHGYSETLRLMNVDVWAHLDTGAIVRLEPKAGLNYTP